VEARAESYREVPVHPPLPLKIQARRRSRQTRLFSRRRDVCRVW
jgi:hypothetical protein